MALTKQQQDYISKLTQILARLDDALTDLSGAFTNAPRICEFNSDVFTPKIDAEGHYAMTIADEDVQALFGFTAQELAAAFFGIAALVAEQPMNFTIQIGKVRA